MTRYLHIDTISDKYFSEREVEYATFLGQAADLYGTDEFLVRKGKPKGQPAAEKNVKEAAELFTSIMADSRRSRRLNGKSASEASQVGAMTTIEEQTCAVPIMKEALNRKNLVSKRLDNMTSGERGAISTYFLSNRKAVYLQMIENGDDRAEITRKVWYGMTDTLRDRVTHYYQAGRIRGTDHGPTNKEDIMTLELVRNLADHNLRDYPLELADAQYLERTKKDLTPSKPPASKRKQTVSHLLDNGDDADVDEEDATRRTRKRLDPTQDCRNEKLMSSVSAASQFAAVRAYSSELSRPDTTRPSTSVEPASRMAGGLSLSRNPSVVNSRGKDRDHFFNPNRAALGRDTFVHGNTTLADVDAKWPASDQTGSFGHHQTKEGFFGTANWATGDIDNPTHLPISDLSTLTQTSTPSMDSLVSRRHSGKPLSPLTSRSPPLSPLYQSPATRSLK